MNAQIEDYTRTIAPHSTVPLTLTGSQFLCFALSATTLQVKFDTTNPIPVFQGLRIALPDKEKFSKVTFINTGAAAVTVSFYLATGLDIELTKLT